MKILITGLIAFAAWSAVSSYWYICKIKNLCPDETMEEVVMIAEPEPIEPAETVVAPDTTSLPAEVEIVSPGSITLRCDYNRAEFNPSPQLDTYLRDLVSYINKNQDQKILVTGHTDIIGTTASNQVLGMQRAEQMKKYLTEHGIEAERITIESKGDSAPVAGNETDEGRAKNRRVEINIAD